MFLSVAIPISENDIQTKARFNAQKIIENLWRISLPSSSSSFQTIYIITVACIEGFSRHTDLTRTLSIDYQVNGLINSQK
jgi:hypothetical protein